MWPRREVADSGTRGVAACSRRERPPILPEAFMFPRLRRPRFLILGVLVLLAIAGGVWWRFGPLATLRLPDGSAIHLRRVTFGREHKFPTLAPARASMWENMRRAIVRPRAAHQTRSDGPAFHFDGGLFEDNHSADHIQGIRVYWEDGRLHEREARLLGHGTLWADPVFPRRGKTFRVQVKIRGKFHDWELPNPLHGQAFPEWAAEPFPARRTIGDFEYSAEGWAPSEAKLELPPQLKFRGRMLPASSYHIYETVFSDPTGNSSSAPISSAEPAWKVRQGILAGLGEALTPDHDVSLAKFIVPQAGSPLIQRAAAEDDLRMWVAYTPGGTFAFENGNVIAAPAPNPVGPPRLPFRVTGDAKTWTLEGGGQNPGLWVIIDAEKKRSGEGGSYFELHYLRNGTPTDAMLEFKAHGEANGRIFTLHHTPLAEPAGTEIETRMRKLETFEVELLLAPPKAER